MRLGNGRLLWFPVYRHACACWPFTNGWEATRLDCLFSFLLPILLFFLAPFSFSDSFSFACFKWGKRARQNRHTRDTEKKRVKWKQRKLGMSYLTWELHNLKAVSIMFPCKLLSILACTQSVAWKEASWMINNTTRFTARKKKNNALVSLKSQACIGDTANTNSTCRKYGTHQILIQMVPDTSTRSQQKAVDSRTV